MKEPINPSSNSTTPGVLLKNAREEKGLTIVDVAARLCLSVQFIQDIERDDYSHLSATTYARGYVRSYAHLLGIPEDTIVASLDNTQMEFIPPKNMLPLENESRIPITQPSENSHPRSSLLRWGSILVLLILAGLVVMWWRGPANQNTTPASTTMTNVSIQPAGATPATTRSGAPPSPANSPAVNQPNAGGANPAPSATAPNLPPPAATTPGVPVALPVQTPKVNQDNAPAPGSANSQDEPAPIQAVKKNTAPAASSSDDTTPVQPSEVGPRQKHAVTLPAPRAGDDD